VGATELVRSAHLRGSGSRGPLSAVPLTNLAWWASGAAVCARRGVGNTLTVATAKPGTAAFNTAAFKALAAVFAASTTRKSPAAGGAFHPLARADGWVALIQSPAGAKAWDAALAAAVGPKEKRPHAFHTAFIKLLKACEELSTSASRPRKWRHAAHFDVPNALCSLMTTAMERQMAGPPARVAWYKLTIGQDGQKKNGGPFVMKETDDNSAAVQIVLIGDIELLDTRHIDPPAFNRKQARQFAQDLRNVKKDRAAARAAGKTWCLRVLALWGPSGAGKTVAAAATARELKAPFAVYLTPSSTVPEVECNDPALKGTRGDRACTYIRTRLQECIPCELFEPPPTTAIPKPFVLILDEFGAHPGFISAVLSARLEITAAIRQHLQVDSRTPVYIIVAGTGVEGASLKPGSQGESYHLRRVEPQLFADFKTHMPPSIYKFVTKGASPLACRLRQLVSNARCAAAFATTALESLNLTDDANWKTVVATQGLMRAMGMVTTTEYVSRNGLKDKSHSQLNHAILRSMGTLFSLGTLPDDVVVLKTIAGLVGDRGEMNATTHTVAAPSKEPRYEVASAFEAMLQILFGLGDRPSSGEGFEQAFADFLAVGIQMSSLSDFTAADVAAMMTHCKTEPPHGWSAPLSVVPWLRDLGRVVKTRASPPPSVTVRQARNRLQYGENFEKLSLIAGFTNTDANGDSHADIVLNGDKAAFADVIAWFNDSVVLCQAKRYTAEGTTSQVTFNDIVKELHKMGCRDPSVVAARWAATADLAAMCRNAFADATSRAQHFPKCRRCSAPSRLHVGGRSSLA
jgi:hypothetical protein